MYCNSCTVECRACWKRRGKAAISPIFRKLTSLQVVLVNAPGSLLNISVCEVGQQMGLHVSVRCCQRVSQPDLFRYWSSTHPMMRRNICCSIISSKRPLSLRQALQTCSIIWQPRLSEGLTLSSPHSMVASPAASGAALLRKGDWS